MNQGAVIGQRENQTLELGTKSHRCAADIIPAQAQFQHAALSYKLLLWLRKTNFIEQVVADRIERLIDKLGIRENQPQARISLKGLLDNFNLVRMPNVVLIAETNQITTATFDGI